MREAHQAGALQPAVLVSHEADREPVLDGRDPAAPVAWGATPEALAAPDWRVRMRSGEASRAASTWCCGAGDPNTRRNSRSSTTKGGWGEGAWIRSGPETS